MMAIRYYTMERKHVQVEIPIMNIETRVVGRLGDIDIVVQESVEVRREQYIVLCDGSVDFVNDGYVIVD